MSRESLPNDVEANIRGLLPEIPYRKEFVNKNDIVGDQDVEELEDALRSHPRIKPWSSHPRLYALLRMSMLDKDEDITAEPFVLDGELAEGLSDYGLPFTAETLPYILKERPRLAQRLLDLQAAVKSSSELMSFQDQASSGKHRVAPNPPFVPTEQLAVTQGAFGQVESVRNTKTKEVFARKIMLRSREGRMSDVEGREDRQWRLEHFRNEAEVLRKLHDGVHMVRFWGSYTHPEYFALLFQPVAERTLHDILVDPAPISEMDSNLLRRSFGCLAFGLSWLHSNMIRHKDIKPANILISDGSVLYCDFGSALDGGLRDTTQTEGIPQKRTPRYVSPETYRGEARNEASDVWSLGCVFLEMLTKLTSSSVDELLQSIHEITDASCSVQEVCYWMGVEDDILQIWTTRLTEELESGDPGAWTANMIEEDASKRPTAAEVVRKIQAHRSAHVNESYIGQCCAATPAPEFEKSCPPPSVPIRIPSVRSPPTSPAPSTNHDNNDVSVDSSPEIPSIGDITPPTRAPSEHDETIVVSGEFRQATLIYEAQLPEAQMEILEGPGETQKAISRFTTIRLYEFRSKSVLHSTRQLTFLPGDESGPPDELNFWLPLADTSIERYRTHVLLSWSDCNHHVTEFTNGRTLHSREYRCREPNNALLIHFSSESEAHEFASKVHAPCDTQFLPHGDPIALNPDVTEARWGFSSNGELMQHSTPAEAAHTVQVIEVAAPAPRSNSRGLLVRHHDETIASTSRLYWLPPVIDLTLGMEDSSDSGQSKPSVLVSGLQMPDYKSNVQNVHHSQKDEEGKCGQVELTNCCVSWCFKFSDDRHMFLDGFSEWSLRLCMSIKQLSREKRMWKDKSYGRADLLLFVHEDSASAAITFRLEGGESSNRHWVTGRLPKSNAAERYGDMEASVKLSSYFRKESLHLGSMQATPASAGSEDSAPEVREDRLKTVKITFHSIADKIDFQNQVTQYHNFYGNARNKIHKSSLSSGSYARRATDHSLSLQSTSSSSRRS